MSQLTEYIGFRVTAEERALLEALAQRLERTPSDAMRFVLRKMARELVTPLVIPSADGRGGRYETA